MAKSKKRNNKIKIAVLIAVVLLVVVFALTDFITDIIWFNEVGYTDVYLKGIQTKLTLGIPTFLIVMGLSYVMLSVLKKNFLKKNDLTLKSSSTNRNMNKVGLALSAVLSALLTYLIVVDLWFEILEYFNSTDFNILDPLFGQDISFYMFRYEFLADLSKSAMIIIIGILAVIIIYHTILVSLASDKTPGYNPYNPYEETEEEPKREGFFGFIEDLIKDKYDLDRRDARYVKEEVGQKFKALMGLLKNQIMTLGIFFFIALGLSIMFMQYSLLYNGSGVAYGAGYTDVVVRLNVYRICMVLSIVSAIMLVVASIKKKFKLAIIAPVAMIVVAVAGSAVATFVQNVIVEPNELSMESKYIANNIEYTRLAYNLSEITVEEFEPSSDLDKVDVLNNMETFSNIRINDFDQSEQFYNQTQSIRSYYQFNDVDVDRYYVNGEYTQVFLSAREIQQSNIEDSWLIKHLKYTHGYGITLSRVDKITSSGQPQMLIDSIPPVSEVPEIQIDQPEIYFGELTDDYVIVNTDEAEFDYPSGETNIYCEYEGTGGIELTLVNRLLFAIRENSFKLLVSTNINSDSRILINRNIADRAQTIAPFLAYDTDPYVVTVDGKIYWIIDAYTVSDKYPYSEPYLTTGFNYFRNSVKVVVDAYNGDTDFYIVDESDPIILTYAKIYPNLFKSLDEMPESLQSHLQYPNSLFNIQADVYEKYHMTDVEVFYQNEDSWAIANNINGQSEAVMTANYFIMKLPGEDSAEFVSSIAYTPSGKSNLTGLLVARSDGDNYGDLILYRMPKDRIIYGPAQIEALINQDTDISKEFALWNNSGSTYSRGDMFVIPVENSLVYVEPVYLESTTSSLPEVKRVIVYYNDKLAYANTLSEALDELFGDGAGDPLLSTYPIITGHEMAEEILNEPEEIVVPSEDPAEEETTKTDDNSDVKALIDQITKLLQQLSEKISND